MTNTLIPATAIATRALDGQGQRHTAFTASLYILKTPSGGGCCRASLSSALLTPLVPSRSHPPPTSSDKLKRLVTSSDLSKMDGIFFFFPESKFKGMIFFSVSSVLHCHDKRKHRGVGTKISKSDFSDIFANFPLILTDLNFLEFDELLIPPSPPINSRQNGNIMFFSKKKIHCKIARC